MQSNRMDRLSNNQAVQPRGRPGVLAQDAAMANEFFESFLSQTTLKGILGIYRHMCELLHLKPNTFPHFYPKLRSHLTSWRAKALWKKFDLRASQKCYGKGKICANTRVLIIGAGPCGLRTAIEAQLLGAKVVVVEKRDRLSRNNVLHLWPFVIEDLRALGAKKFFGKFCAGAIDHISIRQLQCILLKAALLLGVEIHTEVSFEQLIEPNNDEKTGWRAQVKPHDHPVSQFEFDVIIGADGKRNTLQGFKRKEFRGKLAIAITANFLNRKTEAEARVEEISGVAFIFNQKFFKDLYSETGIDLENIVYYKDDTHYFVMTAKKASLIEKGVIKQDLADTAKLLAPDNVDREALMDYAKEAANFSTHYQMPDLQFAVNHYGQADVAMFDFTSMYAAENASRIIERHGYKLLSILVGDSLLEPFWPTGSGCARGFLSSLDAAWAIRGWGLGAVPIEVIAERESIFRLLAQTTPENLNKDWKSYTVDPSSRYPNLNKNLLSPHQVVGLYDSDDPNSIKEQTAKTQAITEVPKKRRRKDSHVDQDTLITWVKEQIRDYPELEVNDIQESFKDGRVLCAIIHHYRPDLLDFKAVKSDNVVENNQIAFDILEKELGVSPDLTGEEMAKSEVPDFLTMAKYLTKIYDTFRCEIPHIKHPKLELSEFKRNENVSSHYGTRHDRTVLHTNSAASTGRPSGRHRRHVDNSISSRMPNVNTSDRKPKKRKTLEKIGASVEERQKRLEEIAQNRTERQNKRRQQRKMQTDNFIKSMQMLQANALRDPNEPFEDYSIFLYRQTAPNFEERVKDLEKKFTYIPDRENKQSSNYAKGGEDKDFAARIKDVEEKWSRLEPQEKKPKDLLRAIGKIETSDWNIKQIEKKIQENRLGIVNKDKERVPKWSREEFAARQAKMESKHLERQDSTGGKYSEIDKSIKLLDQKLKEGTTRDLNQQKVAKITEKFGKASEPAEPAPIQKSNSKAALTIATKGSSEYCHFCSKRVYLTERLSAEGRFFHRGCFRCQYCHTLLRMGSFLFDRDGRYGYRFFCTQHYGMTGELPFTKTQAKPNEKQPEQKELQHKAHDKVLSEIYGLDLMDRVQTPERIEFSNLSGHVSSDHEESPDPIDEDEWTDRNFGASTAEHGSSDEDSSSASDTDTDDEDNFLEALEEPATKEGTLLWAERFNRRYSKKRDDDSDSDDYSSDSSSYYENSSEDDESDTATEGEEEIRARELRKQEVRVEPPIAHTDTGTSTEIPTDESSSESSSEIQNSATEISTDSEFAQDEPTPTREFNDFYVTKTRGSGHGGPKKVQVKSGVLQKPANGRRSGKNIELKIAPLVPSPPPIRKPAPNSLLLRTEGYALNRTQSTGGIATKVSLELKKKYLLGETPSTGNIQKSGSASTLDSKLKSFHTNISDCQKLLKPAAEVSAPMKTFVSKLEERTSPLSPTLLSHSPTLSSENKEQATSPIPPPVEIKTIPLKEEEEPQKPFENELEGRPRSPVHETSIIVPTIDWNEQKKANKKLAERFDDDSLSSSSSSDDDEIAATLPKSSSFKLFNNIPKLEIHDDTGEILQDNEMALDSLNICTNDIKSLSSSTQHSSLNDPPKSISSDKKTLNQPKTLPKLENDEMHSIIHNSLRENASKAKELPQNTNTNINKQENDKESVVESSIQPNIKEDNKENRLNMVNLIKDLGGCDKDVEVKSVKNSSGRSTPSFNDGDQATAALTETELSDWARDGAVSDDFEDGDFDINPNFEEAKNTKLLKQQQQSTNNKPVKLEDLNHICDTNQNLKLNDIVKTTDCINSILVNLDNIEFMDTGTETSSDDNLEKNNGYVKFHNEEEALMDSLSPVVNLVETRNPQIVTKAVIEDFDDLSTPVKNTGYCIFEEKNNFGGKVIDLKPQDIADMCKKHASNDHEEDSLLIIEPGTTTEENTVSDSTVKDVTEKVSPLFDSGKQQLITKLEKITENVINSRGEEKVEENNKNNDVIQIQEKLNKVDKSPLIVNNEINEEYEEHCQRLQSKVEFSNAKDSIDIRKSRRKSKPDVSVQPDLIKEEQEVPKKDITLTLTPAIAPAISKSPSGKIYKKEEIEKERNLNQKLIQEMVMNKMKAENKSLERKRRNRNSFSPSRPFELTKSATTDIASQLSKPKSTTYLGNGTYNKTAEIKNSGTSPTTTTAFEKEANVNKFDIKNIHKSQTINAIADYNKNEKSVKLEDIMKIPIEKMPRTRPLSVHSSFLINDTSLINKMLPPNPENALSMPDIRDESQFPAPKAPPRLKNEEAKRNAEKLKQEARLRAQLKSDEDLGLSPEDKLRKLKQRMKRDDEIHDSIESLVLNNERRNSHLYSNNGHKTNKHSFKRSISGDDSLRKLSLSQPQVMKQPSRTKSVSEISTSKVKFTTEPPSSKNSQVFCKSDPNLINNGGGGGGEKKDKKRTKDRERSKSITKFISNILGNTKKKDSLGSKGLFGIISPKTKDKSKSCVNLGRNYVGKILEEPPRQRSFSELTLHREQSNVSPPPIPPLPTNYARVRLNKDDSSDGEGDWKKADKSSCDTLDQSGIGDGPGIIGRKNRKSITKAVKQAQYKRHRMAQEIQRKLEETEVKSKELEQRGVAIEKALRGEGGSKESSKDESELLKEWFDLMRDITDLRRYERELNVRAQELELEDRHARLQHELRERLENDEHKTKEDVEIEGSIITEMMDIVAKRDSLIALLEEDRLRYSEEDRDFEGQMLSKGMPVTQEKLPTKQI